MLSFADDDLTVGLFTDAFRDLSLEQVLQWAAANGIRDLELGTGGSSPSPHVNAESLTDNGATELLRQLESHDLRIAAFNCSGNPLFPEPVDDQNPDDVALRSTLAAAARLGVPRVVCMSGCPAAGPGHGTRPAFLPFETFPEDAGAVDWQWSTQLLPYWRNLLAFARENAPGVTICLELDPGVLVYTPTAFRHLLAEIDSDGSVLRVNLDPSHLFWQGMDPIAVAQALGGLVGHVHGKDTIVNAERVRQDGVLAGPRSAFRPDELPHRFVTVGEGHDRVWWSRFCRALTEAGYRGPISIEWEDDHLPPAVSVVRAVEVLTGAIADSRGEVGAPP